MSTIRHLINVGFLAALCVSLGLVCGHVTPFLRFQLVGFTSQAIQADAGVLEMTLACQTEFPGTRVCAYREVADTVSVPASLTGEGLVHANDPPAFGFPFDCMEGGSSAFVVSPAGKLSSSSCVEFHVVACCALRP